MAHVIFSHINASGIGRSISADLAVNATWNLLSTGQAGEATISIPINSDALDSDYISSEGGSWVRILGHSSIGEWRGYITNITERHDATIIRAVEWWSLLQHIPVQQYRVFVHITPAVIVKAAMSASPWPLVGYAEAPPDIERWEFTGESLWDHIQQMMEYSGQELYYDSDRQFHWGRQSGTTDLNQKIVAPFDLNDAVFDWDTQEIASQVTVMSNNEWYTARGNDSKIGRVAVIKENLSTNAMASRAESELVRRSEPIKAITGNLTENYWSVQLGDVFGVFVPYANLGSGFFGHCRVISRTYDDASAQLTTRFQVLAPQQTSGVPNPLGGFRFQSSISRQKRWQDRRFRYLGGEGEGRF